MQTEGKILNNGYPLWSRKRTRIHALDFVRGICILLMAMDHLTFDLMMLPEFAESYHASLYETGNWIYNNWWNADVRIFLRLPVIVIFFTLAGISTSFSRNNFARGFKLGTLSACLSLVTVLADMLFNMGISIIFGVLHCMTMSILLVALIKFLAKDKAKYICLALGVVMLIIGLQLDFYQQNPANDLTNFEIGFGDYINIMLGIKYYGADCFGMLPYTGIFLVGVYIGAEVYDKSKPTPLSAGKPIARDVEFVGKNAVWFYLLHQPVILGVVVLLAMSYGVKFF